MTATVSLSGSTWTLAITDTTKGWNYSIGIPTPSPAPQQVSAEWIAERPGVNGGLATLSDFSSFGFTGATASNGATSGRISDFSFYPFAMYGSTMLAAPGKLGPDGQSFTANWYAGS